MIAGMRISVLQPYCHRPWGAEIKLRRALALVKPSAYAEGLGFNLTNWARKLFEYRAMLFFHIASPILIAGRFPMELATAAQ